MSIKAKVISVAQLKGGSGKTTTCKILATSLVKAGKTVLFLDLDGQETGVFWWNRRIDFLESEISKAVSHMAIAKIERMSNLTAIGYDPLVKGWSGFIEKMEENQYKYDYIVIDTPGHIENPELQENVFTISDLVLVPAKATVEDLEQMEKMESLINNVKTDFNCDFKAFSVVYTFDKTDNAYNDYSVLEKVKDTLPLIKYAGDDLTIRFKKSDLAASKVGCTAIEYGSDYEAKSNFKKLGLALIKELESTN